MSGSKRLMLAIESKNIEKLSALLKEMDVDDVNGKHAGQTALHFACREKYNEAVDLLVAKHGIDVNVKNINGMTPLHEAIIYNNAHAVTKILTNPQVNVNVQDARGMTALHEACVNNRHEIVSELLASPGVDVNVKDRHGKTPIMSSAYRCGEKTLKLMLEDTRIDVDAKDEEGRGLEVLVERGRGDSKEKEKCLKMINDERRKRETSKVEQEQPRQDGKIGQRIEKVDKLNKEMEDLEKKWKANLDIRKQKKRDLNERQSVEKKMVARKHKDEETTMNQRHKDEQNMLETTLAREDQTEQRHMAILRERRNELAHDLQNLAIDPAKDTSEDRGKVEAAEESLECPVCMELMRPPTRIWMCHLSHIICESCKEGLDKKEYNRGICPTCSTGRVTQRAFVAENFARTIFNE